MIKLEVCIFGICLKLDLHIHRVPKNADKCPNKEEGEKPEEHESSIDETPINEQSQEYNYFDESNIMLLAKQYENELKRENTIYNIPTDEDIPPRYQINDDVEIITDKFEKEYEDIIEGRR